MLIYSSCSSIWSNFHVQSSAGSLKNDDKRLFNNSDNKSDYAQLLLRCIERFSALLSFLNHEEYSIRLYVSIICGSETDIWHKNSTIHFES